MADNILVMDVEGTDGRERGEDQDFERKSALFALATSEVLIVNIWEHQVGLYQGANMGLLKTVFEVNLQIFIKGSKSMPRSLLLFVIRDHIGHTPLKNLRNTLMADLEKLWHGISKPPGLEDSKIADYFDFAFAALPHKILQPEKFEAEVAKLGTRFREGYKDPKRQGLLEEDSLPILLPEYHRRVPADGFSLYAKQIWEQIVDNKDLDLPTQQELLAQFRCDEIAREVQTVFDAAITPLEEEQSRAVQSGNPTILSNLGLTISTARSTLFKNFETEASRYHKGVYTRKREEIESTVDTRLKTLFKGQLTAIHKAGVAKFSEAVTTAVKGGQKGRTAYDFAQIVELEKKAAIANFTNEATASGIEGVAWSSDYNNELRLFEKELNDVSSKLRKEEMRRLAIRVERWVKGQLDEKVGVEFNKLGSGRGGSGAPEHGEKPTSNTDIWDRVWNLFTATVQAAEKRFTDSASRYDASPEEVSIGLWRLRRKSWTALKSKIEEETSDANLGLKLRENFEDAFRYDDKGNPRFWTQHDDIDGPFSRARDNTLKLIPLLKRFKLSATASPPPLDAWIGTAPPEVQPADEEDLVPIGGVDTDSDEAKSLEDETTILSSTRATDLETRFRRAADSVFTEAKRGALGGVTSTPWYVWLLLLVLGQNEARAILFNPALTMLVFITAIGVGAIWYLNLQGVVLGMAKTGYNEISTKGKDVLRDFLANTEVGREARAMALKAQQGAQNAAQSVQESVQMDNLSGEGKKVEQQNRAGSLSADE